MAKAKTKDEVATDVAVIPNQEVATVEERQARVGQGSQNVTQRDMMIPRLKLLQKISPEVDKSDAKWIEGAEVGMIMNSVSSELFDATFCVNLSFDHKFTIWKKRKFGSGLFGSGETESECVQMLEDKNEIVEQYDITETPTHLMLLLDSEGEAKGVALLDMPGTKAKVSRRWNTLISEQEGQGNPRFGCIWELSSISEDSPNGSYSNFKVDLVVVAGDETYQAAEAAYDSFFANDTAV